MHARVYVCVCGVEDSLRWKTSHSEFVSIMPTAVGTNFHLNKSNLVVLRIIFSMFSLRYRPFHGVRRAHSSAEELDTMDTMHKSSIRHIVKYERRVRNEKTTQSQAANAKELNPYVE